MTASAAYPDETVYGRCPNDEDITFSVDNGQDNFC